MTGSGSYIHSVGMMGTVLTIHVVGHEDTAAQQRARSDVITRAVAWFERVERDCSRFDSESIISILSSKPGVPVAVGRIVFEAVRFALAVAAETDGAFDPTVGAKLEQRGFDESYRDGRHVNSGVGRADADRVTFHDVHLDDDEKTITIDRPLVLDLGAVAKGLAIDLAARELAPLENFAIDAGGDGYFAGHNAGGTPWTIGVRHPREAGALIETLEISNAAVCTSGDYERVASSGHHILHPRTGSPADDVASVTVVAPTAMVADALGTAAFVLGPERGIELLERHGVDALIVTPTLDRVSTHGMRRQFVLPPLTTAA